MAPENDKPGRPGHRRRWLFGAGVLLALFVGMAGFMEYRQRDLYWYDVTSDYRFGFVGEDVERHPVQLAGNAFVMPSWTGDWQTAMLRVNLRGDLLSKWFEPSIETVVGNRPGCRQHFERGMRGERYVSLCARSSDVAAGSRVELRGDRLDVGAPDAELLLFRVRSADSARVLVLAPHPDDAEIAAFGLYANRNSWIVTLTTGSYGGRLFRDLANSPSEQDSLQAVLRTWDSMVVPTLGGLPPDRAINLGYFTTRLEAMHETPSAEVANTRTGATAIRRTGSATFDNLGPPSSTWTALVRDLTTIIDRVDPQVIVFPHPALDANRDHIFTALAVLESLERLGDPVLELYLYTNHHVLSEYYPFGPADAAVTLPPWLDPSTPFRSVYAPALDPGRQRAKLFALDAMHDLRASPEQVVGSVPMRIVRRIRDVIVDVFRDPARELSYMRRAVRPNEMFFVYSASDRASLQQLLPAQVARQQEAGAGPARATRATAP